MNSEQLVMPIPEVRLEKLLQRVSLHIESARHNVMRTVNTQMVHAYWNIGQEIVEEEQHGEAKAVYGTTLLKKLSLQLRNKYGQGFGVRTLEDARKFYLEYPSVQISEESLLISHTLREKSFQQPFHPHLGWSHYRLLMRIKRKEAREFYKNEILLSSIYLLTNHAHLRIRMQ